MPPEIASEELNALAVRCVVCAVLCIAFFWLARASARVLRAELAKPDLEQNDMLIAVLGVLWIAAGIGTVTCGVLATRSAIDRIVRPQTYLLELQQEPKYLHLQLDSDGNEKLEWQNGGAR